jgi:bifunctional DNA-binding transcriptional regulator/antitoxin component of YhaV-PrlF toxin-antitoxin module
MDNNKIYLDKKVLQKDMRIRLPVAVKENLRIKEGCFFNIYVDKDNKTIVLEAEKK